MASRKAPSAPEWQAILERIESQNRMTIEAVEVSRAVMDDRFQSLESHLGGRIGNLETAMKGVIGHLSAMHTRQDGLDGRMDHLEGRQARGPLDGPRAASKRGPFRRARRANRGSRGSPRSAPLVDRGRSREDRSGVACPGCLARGGHPRAPRQRPGDRRGGSRAPHEGPGELGRHPGARRPGRSALPARGTRRGAGEADRLSRPSGEADDIVLHTRTGQLRPSRSQ